MKKTLSLILAIVMALGCMSITAFAAPPTPMPLIVGGKTIALIVGEPPKSEYVNEFGVLTGIDAIKAGTVTYTGPEDNGGIDKLTLNNATIEGDMAGIQTVRYLEIELIGENTISYTGTSLYTSGISLSSMLFSGTGSLIIHNNVAEAIYPTVHTEGSESITLPLGYTAVGSTSGTETDIANMTKVSLDEVAYSQYTYYVGEAPAKTVVIYNPYVGSTDLTLTVAKELSYEMVIPEDVTDLDNFGVFAVGQAKVANVKNATDNTVISYTATTTAFKSEGKSDVPAAYYTDAQGTNAFPTDAVEVYKAKADAASIPTMYVGISETDWDAAENGTYTATVTFNFSAQEKVQNTTVTLSAGEHGTIANLQESYIYPQGTAFSINGNVLTIGDDTFTVTPDPGYPDVKWATNQLDARSNVKEATGTLQGESAFFSASCFPEV